MMKLGWILALISTSALAGCGSHNQAPIVYGTAPNASPNAMTGRIYNSPQEYSAERRVAAQPTYGSGVSYAVASQGPAPLVPVAETSREGRFSYNAEPVYLAQAEAPALAQSAQDLPGQVTVLPGDTVYAISRRTGATPQAIIALNSLAAPFTLSVGQTIRVPSNSVPPTHAALGAPQSQVMAQPVSAVRDGAHVVRPGDTLYSVSRATGVSVADLAAANRLRAPYALKVGETLSIPRAAASAPAPQREAGIQGDVADIARNVNYEAPPAKAPSLFDWPVQGAVIGSFGLSSSGKRNDGVNIAAPVGTPVRAAADGEVVYRGAELEGYGNLLLIKHQDGFVTAYAHNDAMLVKKGDRVRQGQVIAKVGKSGAASEPQLHFEIRQNLKAIDPVALLGSL